MADEEKNRTENVKEIVRDIYSHMRRLEDVLHAPEHVASPNLQNRQDSESMASEPSRSSNSTRERLMRFLGTPGCSTSGAALQTGPKRSAKEKSGESKEKKQKVERFLLNQIIIMRSPSVQSVLQLNNDMPDLRRRKMVIDRCFLNRRATEDEIKASINDQFKENGYIVPSDVSFEFVMQEGKRNLVTPSQRVWDGEHVHLLFYRKKLYLRPNRSLFVSDDESPSEASNMEIQENDSEDCSIVFVETSSTAPISTETNVPTSTSIVNECCQSSINGVIGKIRGCLKEEKTKWTIFRRQALYSVFRKMRMLSFNAFLPLEVTFIDSNRDESGKIHSYEEEGSDLGGLSRELFCLCLRELQTSKMLGGPEGYKVLLYDGPSLMDIKDRTNYEIMGQLIAMSIVQGGPGAPFFAESVYHSILGNKVFTPTIDDIGDADVQTIVRKLEEVQTVQELQELLLTDTLRQAGLPTYQNHLEEKNELVRQALHFYGVVKIEPLLKQFCKGLELYGLLTEIRKNPLIFKPVFCKSDNPLTRDEFLSIFGKSRSEPYCRSEENSQKYVIECEIIDYFEDVLQESEGGELRITEEKGEEVVCSLQDILQFATGADTVPPYGYQAKPLIRFDHEAGSGSIYPRANTCAVTLWLPVSLRNYENFRWNFITGVKGSRGFGVA